MEMAEVVYKIGHLRGKPFGKGNDEAAIWISQLEGHWAPSEVWNAAERIARDWDHATPWKIGELLRALPRREAAASGTQMFSFDCDGNHDGTREEFAEAIGRSSPEWRAKTARYMLDMLAMQEAVQPRMANRPKVEAMALLFDPESVYKWQQAMAKRAEARANRELEVMA